MKKNQFSGVLATFSSLKEVNLLSPKNTITFRKGWV
jgi:hypothetical protein